LLRQPFEPGLVEVGQRDRVNGQVRLGDRAGQARWQRVEQHLVHDVVRERLPRGGEQLLRPRGAPHVVAAVGARGHGGQVHVGERLLHRVRDRVGDAGSRHDRHGVGAGRWVGRGPGCVHDEVVHDRVAEHGARELANLRCGEFSREQITAPATHVLDALDACAAQRPQRRRTHGVLLFGSNEDVDAPRLHSAHHAGSGHEVQVCAARSGPAFSYA
jgi:hypothetical protein